MDVRRIGSLAEVTRLANENAISRKMRMLTGGMKTAHLKIADSMEVSPDRIVDGLVSALQHCLRFLIRGSAYMTDCKRAMKLGPALCVFDEFSAEEANTKKNVPPKP